MRFSVLSILGLCLVLSEPVFAQSSLERWIQQKAAPTMVQFIVDSPRFTGESIRIGVMKNGQVMNVDNRLTRDIGRQFRDYLLTHSRIRMPLDTKGSCDPELPHIVLGIEIEPVGHESYRVGLALVDEDEGVWINGSLQSWQGRLSREERTEFVAASADEQVLEEGNFEGISGALIAGLGCIDAMAQPILVDSDSDVLRRLLVQKIGQLGLVTEDAGEAATHLKAVVNAKEVQLLLAGQGRESVLSTVRVASSSLNHSLLGEFRIRDSENYCSPRDPDCVDVGYELHEKAYAIEFFTRGGKLVPVNCKSGPRIRHGEKSFGLKVPVSVQPGQASIGYYILATSSYETALGLQALLEGPGHRCGRESRRVDLASLMQLVSANNVDWRAMHLVNYGGQVYRKQGGV